MSVMCYVILLCHFCGCRLVVVVRSSELWFVKKSISRFNCENIVANNICN